MADKHHYTWTYCSYTKHQEYPRYAKHKEYPGVT